MRTGYVRLEGDRGSSWCCEVPERESFCWDHIWQKSGGGAIFYAVGTIFYHLRHIKSHKYEAKIIKYAYGFKGFAIPLFLWAIADSRWIDKEEARAFTKQAACNLLTLLALETIEGVCRELKAPEEALIATEITSTLIISVLFYKTFKKFRPAMYSSISTDLHELS